MASTPQLGLWNMIQLTDEGIALNYEIRDVTFFWETELTNSHPHWFVVGPEYSESMVIIVIEQLLMNCHNFRVENNQMAGLSSPKTSVVFSLMIHSGLFC